MTPTRYDFTDAQKWLNECYSPSDMSAILKDKALRLVAHDYASMVRLITEMQLAVLDVCEFLDTIKAKER